MSRFDDIDLARLPKLDLGTQTFDALKQARIGELVARLKAYGFEYDVDMLETDPLVVANAEAGAARELLTLFRRDDAVRAVLLSESWGPFLDALGASQTPPVQRNVVRPASDDAPAVMEEDDDYRRRIQLAPEALSGAGPEGAYLFYALGLDGVKMAAAYGPMSFDGSRLNPFSPLAEAHVVVVSSAGDGAASPELLAALKGELRQRDRYPLCDFPMPMAAEIVPYTIDATLFMGGGADPGLVVRTGLQRLRRQALRQHRPGAPQLQQMLYGAAYVPDENGAIIVDRVGLAQPSTDVNAVPITRTTPGAAYRAPYCYTGAPGAEPVITNEAGVFVGRLGDITVRGVVDDG